MREPRPDSIAGAAWAEQVLARFRQATGIGLGAALVTALPDAFLDRPAPSPDELIAGGRLGRRTSNALRRSLSSPDADAPWTFRRLIEIPGFGMAALVDVLESRAGTKPRPPRTVRTLDEELAEMPLTAALPGPRATPLLDRAIDAIASRLPAGEEAISRRLRALRLVRGPVDLAQIERAARFHARALPFTVLRRDGLVVAIPFEKLALCRIAYDMASRSLGTWGLATVSDVCYRIGTEALELVTEVLTAHRSFQWLERRQGWFWFRNWHSQLFRTIEKILAVAESVSLADLARTLFRRRLPTSIPPVRVLARLCRQVPRLEVKGQIVRLVGTPAAALLSETDTRVVELFRKLGPRIDFRRSTLSLRTGVDFDGTLRRLRSSPLVLEPQPGVFQLIGS